jgi:hypothetical protein
VDASHRRRILDKWVIAGDGNDINDLIWLYKKLFSNTDFHNKDLQHWSYKLKELDLSELKGKNLACFCKDGEKCHADVLLELANK